MSEYGYDEAFDEAHEFLKRHVELKHPNIAWHEADTKTAMDNHLMIFKKYFGNRLRVDIEPFYFEANSGMQKW